MECLPCPHEPKAAMFELWSEIWSHINVNLSLIHWPDTHWTSFFSSLMCSHPTKNKNSLSWTCYWSNFTGFKRNLQMMHWIHSVHIIYMRSVSFVWEIQNFYKKSWIQKFQQISNFCGVFDFNSKKANNNSRDFPNFLNISQIFIEKQILLFIQLNPAASQKTSFYFVLYF